MVVEFEDKRIDTDFGMEPEARGITGWLISLGIASSRESANKILLIVFIIFVLATISVFVFNKSSKSNSPEIPFEERNSNFVPPHP